MNNKGDKITILTPYAPASHLHTTITHTHNKQLYWTFTKDKLNTCFILYSHKSVEDQRHAKLSCNQSCFVFISIYWRSKERIALSRARKMREEGASPSPASPTRPMEKQPLTSLSLLRTASYSFSWGTEVRKTPKLSLAGNLPSQESK